MEKYTGVLTIAGSDSGGGAGIQADLKTISALGCYGMSVITAITAQNTQGVAAIHPVPVDIIKKQAEAVLSDIATDAVKIGMLHSIDVINTVADILIHFKPKNIVLDPVMVATSGDKLIGESIIEALIDKLFPLVDLITPNIPEAEIILGKKLSPETGIEVFAQELLKCAGKSVLLKGGHLGNKNIVDYLVLKETGGIFPFKNKKVNTKNTHGTGCTLSSAIASYLARGNSIKDAVKYGIAYIQEAIFYGITVETGKGHGPVNHFFNPEKLKGRYKSDLPGGH